MRHARSVALAMLAVSVLVVACSSDPSPGQGGSASSTPAGDPSSDKLAQILARGTLVLSTDTEYPPSSFAVKGEERRPDTACAQNQLTANQVSGYDAETGKLLAEELGVEGCFVTPTYTEVTAGSWGDRWDISFSSGCINEERLDRLWMTQPYTTSPSQYFVLADGPYQGPSDLNGKRIGACAGCSDEFYLEGTLVIPGVELVPTVQDPQVVLFDVEQPGLKQVAAGKLDAFLSGTEVGRAAIAEGLPLRELKQVAYSCYPSGFVDQSSGLDSAAFVGRVDEIIKAAIADGRLPELSNRFFGRDYATDAAEFDTVTLGQELG